MPTIIPHFVSPKSVVDSPAQGGFASVFFRVPDLGGSSSDRPSSSSQSSHASRQEAFHSIVQHLQSILSPVWYIPLPLKGLYGSLFVIVIYLFCVLSCRELNTWQLIWLKNQSAR